VCIADQYSHADRARPLEVAVAGRRLVVGLAVRVRIRQTALGRSLFFDAVLVADSGRQQIRPPFVFPVGQGLRLRVEQLHFIAAFVDPDEIRLAARQSGDCLGFVPGVFVTGAIHDPIAILKAVAGT
jgi:hypothetical protein